LKFSPTKFILYSEGKRKKRKVWSD